MAAGEGSAVTLRIGAHPQAAGPSPLERELLEKLEGIVGPRFVEADAPCADWRRLFHGKALAVVQPSDTRQVAACVGACAAHGARVVPLGGNTGLCGGATPIGREVVISLARLNRLRDVDPVDMSLIAEAGVTLDAARAAAADCGVLLPISLASGGSAQIGGVVSTNAGGNSTLRFGNMREQVLGLEVVLADGRVWNGLRRLRKDNTGLPLRQLFIGAEGTLGIVTAACLRLVSAPRSREVALVVVPSVEAAVGLLDIARRADEAGLHAFEYMSGEALRMVVSMLPGGSAPFPAGAAGYVLMELTGPRHGPEVREVLEAVLAESQEIGLVSNALMARSESQRAGLWRLRELQSEAQARAGANVKNDISVPISRIPAFVADARRACLELVPGVRVVEFGHLGDGNIHFNLVQPEGADPAAFLARADALMAAVNEAARAHGGSFSAEHGVGQLKVRMLEAWRGEVEMDLMRRVKAALDPAGTFNPGKILLF